MELPESIEARFRSFGNNLLTDTDKIRSYVSLMMTVMGRGLISISRFDPTVKKETAGFPVGFRFEMVTLPDGPSVRLRLDLNREFEADESSAKPDLSIQFKHLRHAFTVLSFQEGTVRAFANNRMVVDGDLAFAMRMVRILNRLQSIILPEAIARRAVKRYQPIPLGEKATGAMRIYGDVAAMALKGDNP